MHGSKEGRENSQMRTEETAAKADPAQAHIHFI